MKYTIKPHPDGCIIFHELPVASKGVTTPFTVTAYANEPRTRGAVPRSLGEFEITRVTHTAGTAGDTDVFRWIRADIPNTSLVAAVLTAICAHLDTRAETESAASLVDAQWRCAFTGLASDLAALERRLTEHLDRVRKDMENAGHIATDHESALIKHADAFNQLARSIRIQDQLNKHGFANIEAAITALQQQPRKTPRKRNRNK